MNNTAVNLLIYKENVFFKLAFDMPPHPNSFNALIVNEKIPLLTVGVATIFSKLDLTLSFHQSRIWPHDIPKMSFHIHDGHSKYQVMPFNLCNTFTTFQATIMNDIFSTVFVQKFHSLFFFTISLCSTHPLSFTTSILLRFLLFWPNIIFSSMMVSTFFVSPRLHIWDALSLLVLLILILTNYKFFRIGLLRNSSKL